MTDEIRLYMFDGGTTYLPLRNFTFGQGGNGEMITTPTPFFVITHPRGNAVIDGGNPPEVAVDAGKHWGPITEMSTPHMTPEQALLPSLERAGIDPASIRWVVQTHLHLDHTGAVAVIDRLPNAEVLVTRTEHDYAHAPDSFMRLAYVLADYAKPGVPWALLEDSEDGYDVYGDGTLIGWRSPGHSPGHMSFEVNLPSGATYLLCGDAANARDHWENGALPGFMFSAADTARSLSRLKRLAWRRDAIVVTGHDPGLWDDFKRAPEFYS